MHFDLTEVLVSKDSDCLVLGYFDNTDFEHYARFLDVELKNLLTLLAKKLSKNGAFAWQSIASNGLSLMLINCGKPEEFSPRQLNLRLTEISASLIKHNIEAVSVCLPPVFKLDPDSQLIQMVRKFADDFYQLLDYKTKDKKTYALKKVDFYLKAASTKALLKAKALIKGMELCKTLANLPANRCTPSFLGDQAQELAKEFSEIKVTVLGKERIAELGMGALLAVSQGSAEPPRFIEIIYKGDSDPKANPCVIIGKGITFDSGGINIKASPGMDEMKYDMAGAASVIGTIKACAALKLPLNIVGLIASAENLPSGTAVKPGDIITTMAGKTVEIINTDAEGRLILADALCYAERFSPRFVIDVATLTGAVIIALGHINTGLMTTDENLALDILNAAKEAQDPCWRLPLEEDYQEALDSPLADMINANFDRAAGSVTAACFLSRFSKKYPWAHLDIAGTAWVSGKKRHATGRPVSLLLQILYNAAYKN